MSHFKSKNEKIMTNSLITNKDVVIPNFLLDSIESLKTLYHCEAFTLSKGILKQEHIIMLAFNFFDTNKLKKEELNSKITCNKKKFKHTLSLKHIGYKHNNLYLIYDNPHNDISLLITETFLPIGDIQTISDYKSTKSKYIKQILNDIRQILQTIHNANTALNLLHPYLIFYNTKSENIILCDDTFYICSQYFNKHSNSSICHYFGIYLPKYEEIMNKSYKHIYFYQSCDVMLYISLKSYFEGMNTYDNFEQFLDYIFYYMEFDEDINKQNEDIYKMQSNKLEKMFPEDERNENVRICGKCCSEFDFKHQCDEGKRKQIEKLQKEFQYKNEERKKEIGDKKNGIVEIYAKSLEKVFEKYKESIQNVKRRISKKEYYTRSRNEVVRDMLMEYANKCKNEIIESDNRQKLFTNDIIMEEFNEKFNSFEKQAIELNNILMWDNNNCYIIDVLQLMIKTISNEINEKCISSFRSELKTFFNEIKSKLSETSISYVSRFHFTPLDLIEEYLYCNEPFDPFVLTSLQPKQYTLLPYSLINHKTPESLSFEPSLSEVLNSSCRILNTFKGVFLSQGFDFYYISNTPNQDKSYTVKILEKMKNKHSDHCMLRYNVYNIIVIGGILTSTCELYNMLKCKWEEMPDLNNERAYHCGCVINDRYIYVVCGVNSEGKACDDIEMFDTGKYMENDKCKCKWDVIKLKENKFSIIKYATVRVDGKDNEKLIICGGKYENENSDEDQKGCTEINLNNYQMYRNDDIQYQNDLFYESQMITN